MTDRQLGGDGLVLDVATTPVPQVGAAGVTIEVRTPAGIAHVGLSVELPVGASVRQPGSVALLLDVVPDGLRRRAGYTGTLIDYVPSLVDAVTWAGPAFNIGGAFADVHWAGGQFQASSGPRVLWDDTAGTFTLEGV